MSLSSFSDFPVCIEPGSWVVTAQTALQALAECADLAGVERCFGPARQLAAVTLGYPVNGGHATKPVIRALGQALSHPYGPAVAVAPLAFCAAAYDELDDRMIVEVLEAAQRIGRSFEVPNLAVLRDFLLATFEGLKRPERTDWLAGRLANDTGPAPKRSRWNRSRVWSSMLESVCWTRAEWPRLDQGPDDLVIGVGRHAKLHLISQEWIGWLAGREPGEPAATVEVGVAAARGLPREVVRGIFVGPSDGGPVIDRPLAPGETEVGRSWDRRWRRRRRQAEFFGAGTYEYPAHELDLDVLPAEVLGVLVRRDVLGALHCSRLPAGLAEHVEFPYDLGTIELALRAHPVFVDGPTLRWRLAHLPDDDLVELAGRAPQHLADALAGLELIDEPRRLMRVCPRSTAQVMAEWMPAPALRVDDVDAIEELAPWRAEQCPGVMLSLEVPKRRFVGVLDDDDRHLCWNPTSCGRSSRPYAYAPAVEDLVASLVAIGWEAELPLDGHALEANAERMHNCTAGYDSSVREGRCAILHVVRPDGRHFIVEVRPSGEHGLVIGQVAGRFNTYDGVGEVRDVIAAAVRRGTSERASRVRISGRPRNLRRRPGGGVRTPRSIAKGPRVR
jgi:hypothetical protein